MMIWLNVQLIAYLTKLFVFVINQKILLFAFVEEEVSFFYTTFFFLMLTIHISKSEQLVI